jgi:maleylacetate reductase
VARDFVFTAFAQRILFGIGCVEQLAVEMERLGVSRGMILCSPANSQLALRTSGRRVAGVFHRTAMHVPVGLVEQAFNRAAALKADCYVTLGGGSTIGLGKALALQSGLPIVAIPTTYAGSEVTPIYGVTDKQGKRTGRDLRVLPKVVIYDPALSLTLPKELSAASGMNAIGHCVEALYAHDRNPISELMAEEAVRVLALALPAIRRSSNDLDARSSAMYGAWLAGSAFAGSSMALHHKLCHVLGGTLRLPHAESHAIVLPHVARYNSKGAPEAMKRIARALGVEDAPRGLFDLARILELTPRLADLGMQEGEVPRIATLACKEPYPNPVAISREGVTNLLLDAFHGIRPRASARSSRGDSQ